MNIFINILRIPIFTFFVIINTSFHGALVSICAPLKFSIPIKIWKDFWEKISYWIAGGFIITNNVLFKLFYKIEWDVKGLDNLSKKGTYLVISNHLSLLDIPVAQKIFFKKIPFLRFFIKQELVWVPFLGQALWALDYPIMKRYSKEKLKKNPSFRGKDLETAMRSSDRLIGKQVTILNYPEGTRFTKSKHKNKKSIYNHLLHPRAGGIHTVLCSLGDQLNALIDVTLVYPGHSSPRLIDFLVGNVKKIVVRIKICKPGENGTPSVETIRSKVGSGEVRNFLNDLWKAKNLRIEKIQNENHNF
tara:strand:- start:18 stop:926 length:909 start_codon:yes stop_codon:yes gene_type:complete